MRWRHVREGRPTAADANRHDEVIVVRPDGAKQSVQWHNLHEDVEWWAPFEELPDPPNPEKKWRPFNDAAEFAPCADKWIARAHKENTTIRGAYRPTGYDDHGIWVVIETTRQTYRELFDQGRRFADGSVFGVEVTV